MILKIRFVCVDFQAFLILSARRPQTAPADAFIFSDGSASNLHFLLSARRSLSNRTGLIPMIHVEEAILDQNTVAIKLEGVLDQSAVPVIESVFDRYPEGHCVIHLDLEGLIHITREGRQFLNEIKQNVHLTHLPEFMRMA